MSPFTHLLGRLVELLGAQSAAQLVREFAGKTIQFPITQNYTGASDAYGHLLSAPVIGAPAVPASFDRIANASFSVPVAQSNCLASLPATEQLQAVSVQLADAYQALQQLSKALGSVHSPEHLNSEVQCS